LSFDGAEPKKSGIFENLPTTLLKGKVVGFEKKVVGKPGLNGEWKTLDQ